MRPVHARPYSRSRPLSGAGPAVPCAMPRILIAGYQHETNTFAPSLADWGI